jgi:hypothetical protein
MNTFVQHSTARWLMLDSENRARKEYVECMESTSRGVAPAAVCPPKKKLQL